MVDLDVGYEGRDESRKTLSHWKGELLLMKCGRLLVEKVLWEGGKDQEFDFTHVMVKTDVK